MSDPTTLRDQAGGSKATGSNPTTPGGVPQAETRPGQTWSWAWLVPLAALIVAGLLAWQAYRQRGTVIRVQFQQAHGIKPGDTVRYRGLVVGEVAATGLQEDLKGVSLRLRLEPQAEGLARAGTRFWIVHPRADWTGLRGLETIVGARYVALAPGEGRPLTVFQGLDEAPLRPGLDPNGLEVQLYADRLGSLRRGAPVLFRQIEVGTLVSVGLATDAETVEARAYIEPAYAGLIRPETKFWDVGGLRVEMGLTKGLKIEAESLASVIAGGVAFATPPGSGTAVANGHRFELHRDAEDEWTQWKPALPVGSALLPPGAPRPSPLRATLTRDRGGWFTAARERRGYVLAVGEGLLGPADLLASKGDASDDEELTVEVAGEKLPLSDAAWWRDHGLMFRGAGASADDADEVPEPPRDNVWPLTRCRQPEGPEDLVVVADPASPGRPVDAIRLQPDAVGEGQWGIEASISFERDWHGAAVLSRQDGRLIGLLLVGKPDDGDAGARVAVLPPPTSLVPPANRAPGTSE